MKHYALAAAYVLFLMLFLSAVSIPARLDARSVKEHASSEGATEKLHDVREPAVAGTFYPSEPEELEAAVDRYLMEAASDVSFESPEEEILMILVPHAGYDFSGRTASSAFVHIKDKDYDTVILIGCPHRVPVQGASVYCGNGFRIPLGTVPIDGTLANAIVESSDLITDDPGPHIQEHSLEVELPFLTRTLGDYSIVPILVSGDTQVLEIVAESIVDAVRRTRGGTEGVLFLISSDLSHYPRAEDSRVVDDEILEAFCSLDTQRLVSTNNDIMGRGIDDLACTMCGLEAAYVGIRIANMTGGNTARVVSTATSADAGIPGASDDRVVGYGSVIVTGTPGPLSSRFEPLQDEEGEFLLRLARETLAQYLAHERIPEPDVPPEYTEHLSQHRGVFVTLYSEGLLRGCIGRHASALPLYRAVQLMVLESALNDPRFPALTLSEVDEIRIELSVYLTHVEPISSVKEYVPGKHGIILKNGGRSATFLPHVPIEQGWDKTDALRELSRKAGLGPDDWKDRNTRFSVYETQIIGEE